VTYVLGHPVYSVSAAFRNSMQVKKLLINNCSKSVQIKQNNKSCISSKCFRSIGVLDHAIVSVKCFVGVNVSTTYNCVRINIQCCSIFLDEIMINLIRIVH